MQLQCYVDHYGNANNNECHHIILVMLYMSSFVLSNIVQWHTLFILNCMIGKTHLNGTHTHIDIHK